MAHVEIEHASLSSWPAVVDEEWNGWRLRFAQGYTKRSNAATALAIDPASIEQGISRVESFYRAHGQPPLFRLLSFTAPDRLDSALALRGYRLHDRSAVLTGNLNSSPLPKIDAAVSLVTIDEWSTVFRLLSAEGDAEYVSHRRILDLISLPRAFAVLQHDGEPVCCGLAVLTGKYLGIFDLVTAGAHRRLGYARRLCAALRAWGAQQGGAKAYLQVTADNLAAMSLYRSVGFEPAYEYWYRVR